MWSIGVLALFPFIFYFLMTALVLRYVRDRCKIDYLRRYENYWEKPANGSYRSFTIGLCFLPFGIILYVILLPVSLAAFLFNLYRLLIDILRLVGHGMFCCFI